MTRAALPEWGVVTRGGSRMWQPTERALVIELHVKLNTSGVRDYARSAHALQRLHPKMFGPGSPGKFSGITRQDVKRIVCAQNQGEKADGRGRPNALPLYLSNDILATPSIIVNQDPHLYLLRLTPATHSNWDNLG